MSERKKTVERCEEPQPLLEKMPQDDAERIALLEEAVDRQLAHLLTHPVPDLAARVRDVKAAMDVLSSLRGKETEHGPVTVSFME